MAIMFPTLSEDAINSVRSRAEGLVYRCCRDQLGPDIVVVHSLALIKLRGALPRKMERSTSLFLIRNAARW